MQIESTIQGLRAFLKPARKQRIAFVPTMGNLHAGHLSLVAHARERAAVVVASIFVNPLQFGPGEDLDSYPRTLEADCAQLERAGVDGVFIPDEEEMYPRPMAETTRVSIPGLSEMLCGAARPGHFTGVATVVNRLFNIVQPDIAVFGKKDYQQLLVIRRMVEDLCIPIDIIGLDTFREADGLAMSSRNGYLSEQERATAPELYRTLRWIAQQLQAKERDFVRLEREAAARLLAQGFKTPDYVAIRHAEDLRLPKLEDKQLVILAAAYLGERARLIDNIEIDL